MRQMYLRAVAWTPTQIAVRDASHRGPPFGKSPSISDQLPSVAVGAKLKPSCDFSPKNIQNPRADHVVRSLQFDILWR